MSNSETTSGNGDTAQQRIVDRAVELKNLQEELFQLRREMEKRFEQQQVTLEKQWSDAKEELAKKVDRAQERTLTKLSRRQIIITSLFLVITGACLIVYLFNFLVHLQPDRRGDVLTILSTLLAMIGGLYLAYDLLGREGGPLARLTAHTTNALIGMLIFTPLMVFASLSGSYSLIAAPTLFVAGMVSGFATISMPSERNVQSGKKSPFFSPKTWAIDIIVSFLFWLFLLLGLGLVGIVIDPALASVPFRDTVWFTVSGPAVPAPTPVQLKLMLGQFFLIVILTSVLMHCLRHFFMMSKPPVIQANFFHWRAFLGAFAVWFILWLAFVWFVAVDQLVAVDQQGTGWWLVAVVAAVIAIGPALVGAMAAGIARFALQWANSLAERRLGLFGLCIATAGVLLACVLPLLDLLK